MRFPWILAGSLALSLTAVSHGQAASMDEHQHVAAKPSVPSTSLVVTVGGKPTTFSMADMQAMPQTTLKVKNGHTGTEETYAGVNIGDLLVKCGFAFEGAAAKRVYHSYVRAEGTDGYWVLYSASELMPILRENGSIIALSIDGKPLEADGQFRIVIAGERRPARWVRNLKSLTVVTAE